MTINLYVSMSGYEENLEASCNLLTRQILMPKLDEKQLNNMIGSAYQMRAIEEKMKICWKEPYMTIYCIKTNPNIWIVCHWKILSI